MIQWIKKLFRKKKIVSTEIIYYWFINVGRTKIQVRSKDCLETNKMKKLEKYLERMFK